MRAKRAGISSKEIPKFSRLSFRFLFFFTPATCSLVQKGLCRALRAHPRAEPTFRFGFAFSFSRVISKNSNLVFAKVGDAPLPASTSIRSSFGRSSKTVGSNGCQRQPKKRENFKELLPYKSQMAQPVDSVRNCFQLSDCAIKKSNFR